MPRLRPRLGEMLVGERLVTLGDVADALASQVVEGGRLGTVLVQLGLVRLDDVGRCLAIQHDVPHANEQALTTITSQALSAVPKEISVKHMVLPLRFEAGDLLVAMLDPIQTVAQVVSFALGLPIKPCVAPELRLLYHLEQLCGYEREARFLRAEEGRGRTNERRKLLRATVVPPAGVPPPRPRDTLAFGLAPDRPQHATGSVDAVVSRLRAAATGATIAELLVEPFLQDTSMSALFWVRGGFAVGCCARGVTATAAEVRRMVVSLDHPSLLQWVLEVQGAVRADGDSDSIQRELARELGSLEPGEVCVAPVILRDKVVNVICIHARPGGRFLPAALDEVRIVCEHAASAYQRVGERLKRGSQA